MRFLRMLVLMNLKVRRGNKEVWEYSDSFGKSRLAVFFHYWLPIYQHLVLRDQVTLQCKLQQPNGRETLRSSPFKPNTPEAAEVVSRQNERWTDRRNTFATSKGRFWSFCRLRGESETWIGRSDPQCCYWIGPAPCQSQPTDQSEAALTRAQDCRLSCCR